MAVLNWTLESTASDQLWRAVAWSPTLNLFAAGSPGNPNKFMTSPDGAVWTVQTQASIGAIFRMVWAPGLGLFVALSSSLTNSCIYTSPDGVNWTQQTTATGAGASNLGLAWSETLGLLCVVGKNQIETSPDGVLWTSQASPANSFWIDVVWADAIGQFIAVSSNGLDANRSMTSANGTLWTAHTGPAASFSSQSAAWSDDLGLIAVVDDTNATGNNVTTSPDGIVWTLQTTPARKMAGIAWDSVDGYFVAVGDQGTGNRSISSPDGVNWTTETTPADQDWRALAYSSSLGKFAAVSQSGVGTRAMISSVTVTGLTPNNGPVAGNTSVTVLGDGTNGGFSDPPGSYFNTYWVLFGDFSGLGLDFNTHVNPSTIFATALTYQPTVTIVSTTELTCVTPPGPDDTVDVVVILNTTNPLVKNLLAYFPAEYTYNPPTLTGISPASGTPLGGTPVALTGENFFNPDNGVVTDGGGTHIDNVVVFGTENPVLGSFVNDTTINVISPANTGTSATVDVILYPGTKTTGALAASVASFSYPASTLTLAWTWNTEWWEVDVGPFTFFFFAPYQPDPLTFPFGFFWENIWYPPFFEFIWALAPVDPDDKGWWLSINDKFNGAAIVVSDAVPRDPRSFNEIATFAAGSAGMQGGFPGVMANWQNRLLYAKGGYTVNTDRPPIHIFDGQFDHEIVTLPPTTSGTIPKGAMSIYTTDGQIFVSTFDSGTSAADWSGRVFALDVEDASLTQIGETFPTGHIPYAFTSHMGKLWCGTNRQDPTFPGRVYSIRPGIDTVWTLERDLTTDSVGGCTSLLSFQGNLYIGTSADTGTFAKVLKRDTAGTYTTSLTGSGGLAVENNAFLALAEFDDEMFASYWNNDVTPVSKIYKFDGSSWTTPFTASTAGTRKPYVGFPTDQDTLLAIGGGLSYTAALLSTTDGTTWNDHTVFLTQASPASTGLPAFGVVIR